MCLLIFNAINAIPQFVQNAVDVVVWPLHELVAYPSVHISHLSQFTIKRKQLIQENRALYQKLQALQNKTIQVAALYRENKQLHQLLALQSQLTDSTNDVQATNVVSVSTNPLVNHVIIDKGKYNGLHLGEAIIDPHGIFGQIIQLGLLHSAVMTVTNPKSAIPVYDTRTGTRAIAIGNQDNLLLINVPKTNAIKTGDLWVSSGLGERFPKGYPVGSVVSNQNLANKRFAQIVLKPMAHLNRASQLLIVSPQPSTIPVKQITNTP